MIRERACPVWHRALWSDHIATLDFTTRAHGSTNQSGICQAHSVLPAKLCQMSSISVAHAHHVLEGLCFLQLPLSTHPTPSQHLQPHTLHQQIPVWFRIFMKRTASERVNAFFWSCPFYEVLVFWNPWSYTPTTLDTETLVSFTQTTSTPIEHFEVGKLK